MQDRIDGKWVHKRYPRNVLLAYVRQRPGEPYGFETEVVLDVEGLNQQVVDPWGGTRMGAFATTKINRKDYGLTWNKALEAGGWLVGDELTINLEIEVVGKK